MRGVGNNNNSNVGSAVLIFIDGVYYPYQFGNLPYNNVLRLGAGYNVVGW